MMVIFSILQITTPFMDIETTVGQPTTPNFGPSGPQPTGGTNKTGDWIVNTNEIYIGDEINLTGNLIIQNGGVLTLQNTILRMNSSATANPLWIIVEGGGTLNVWDSDNNPVTADGSLITDSIHDQDTGGVTDFRYYFRVEPNGNLYINCSAVKECGYYDASEPRNTYGLYIGGDGAIIKNTSFSKCPWAIILENCNNSLIESVSASDVEQVIYGLDTIGTKIQYCRLNSGNIEHGIWLGRSLNTIIYRNNVSVTRWAYWLENVNYSRVIDNYGDRFISVGYVTLYVRYCKEIEIDRMKLVGSVSLGHFYHCENITVSNITLPFTGTCSFEVLKGSWCDNLTIKDCRIQNDNLQFNGKGIEISNCNNVSVLNCSVNNSRYDGLVIYYSKDFRIENCTITNTTQSGIINSIRISGERGIVSNNRVDYSYYANIWVGGRDIVFTNNVIGGSTNTQYGIYTKNLYDSYIAHNTIYYQKTYSIFVSYSKDIVLFNNTLIGFSTIGTGLYADDDSSLILDNRIRDYATGLRLAAGNTVKNTNVSFCYNGIRTDGCILENVSAYQSSNDGLRAYEGTSISKNSSFTGSGADDIETGDSGNLILINCTFNSAKITVDDPSDLYIKWWVNIRVNDINDIIPGALVSVYNKTNYKEVEGLTGDDGHIVLPVTEEWRYNYGTLEVVDMNPHDIIAYVWPHQQNVTPKPTIVTNDNYNIIFTIDTYPPPPYNLAAKSTYSNVLVSWDYPTTLSDLDHFEIFRSIDPGNFGSSPIGTATKFDRSWLDIGGASDWTTYYYLVRANDTAGQLGAASNIAMCGDWGISSSVVQTKLNITLNGSLIVWDGGWLKLGNSTIRINATTHGEHGVLVKAGGILEITDEDDNYDTKFDASNISTNDTKLSIYFIVESDGKLYMNNSIAYGIGYKNFVQVNHSGFYIGGNSSILRNNHIKGTAYTYHGIYIEHVYDVELHGNWFDLINITPINMLSTVDCLIDNNTLNNSDYGIRMYYTQNNTISNNTITNFVEGIELYETVGDRIIDNTLDSHNYAIRTEFSTYILIHNNTITNCTTEGISVYYTSNYCTITKNHVEDNNIGIMDYRSDYLNISSNRVIDHDTTGINIHMSSHSKLINNTVIDSEIDGIKIDGPIRPVNNTVIGGYVSDCFYGLYISRAQDSYVEGIELRDNLYGLYMDYNGEVHVNAPTIINNTLIGVYVKDTDDGYDYNLKIENATLSTPGGTEVELEDKASVIAINVSIPYDSLIIQDSLSNIAFYWYAHVYVEDMFSAPASGAEVTIRQVGGDFYIAYTDNNGYLKWQCLYDKTILKDGNFSANPYTISATLGNHSGKNITVINESGLINVTLDNEPPSVVNAKITPQLPTTLDDLTLSFGYYDPENDPEYPEKIKWFVNGVEDASLQNQKTVPAVKTSKGQNWYAQVQVFDGGDYSAVEDSNLVTIQNTLPVVNNVNLNPNAPTSSMSINVSYAYSDIDNDLEGETIIRWEKDAGAGFEVAYTGAKVPVALTRKGEYWRAAVIPHDGEAYGAEVYSVNTVTILNTPPTLDEDSLEIVSGLGTEPITSSDVLTMSYIYIDIDNDPEVAGNYKWYVDRGDGLGLVYSGINTKTVPASETNKGEQWSCEVEPYDGTDYGITYVSDIVTVGNSPPSVVGEVIVGPSNPTRYDNLTVQYEYFDIDGDPENGTSFSWLVDRGDGAGFVFSGITDDTVLSVYLHKDELWKCIVRPYDGEAFGTFVESTNSIYVGNSPPVVVGLEIEPTNAIGGNALHANYTYFDIDDDTEDTNLRVIKWYRNGDAIEEFENQLTVPENTTTKGERWYFKIIPHDGKIFGSAVTSPAIIIGNSPPTITSSSISPTDPTNADDLMVMYNASDNDGDEMIKVEIQWFRNEVHKPSFDNELIVQHDMTYKGDVWYFKIRVSDGADYSAWVTSPPKLIKNSIPKLDYYYPHAPTPVINETDMITFNVTASDLDNDPLTYFWYLDGEIKSLEKSYELITSYESESAYEVKIVVSDGAAAVQFIWTVTINNVDRSPTLNIQTPEVSDPEINVNKAFDFIITTDDPDEVDKEQLTIQWYLDDLPVVSGETYTYTPKDYEVGKREVKVVVSDGELNTTATWNVTVKDAEKDKAEEGILGMSWDQLGILLEAIVIIITAIFAIIGILKVRKKKGMLKEYMKRIEEIKESKETPKKKEKEFLALKKQVKEEFSNGQISENHYIILERELDDALGVTRKAIVKGKVTMPERLKVDVEDALDDGMVTKEEYKTLVTKITSSEGLSKAEKKRLKKQMTKWMKENDEEDLEE